MNSKRLALFAGGAVALLCAAHVVLVHSGAACPMMGRPSVAALEKQRQRAMPELRGTGASPSSDAFGFALGKTKRDAFLKDSQAKGEECTSELEGALVRCAEPAGSGSGELVARFDPQGVLVGADRVRFASDVAEGAALYKQVSSDHAARFGTPTRSWGNDSPAFLAAAPLRQVGVAYRFEDVAVDLSLTHLGPGRIALREQMRAIPRNAARGG